MYDQAITALEEAVQLADGIGHKGALGRAYVLAGRRDGARRILDELLNRDRQVRPLQIAIIYAAFGQKEDALSWLEEAFRVRDGNMVLLKVWPAWDSLRSEARFRDLLRRMKFP